MKTKFNPEDVSKWCKWIAVDKNGECWEYFKKPYIQDEVFFLWDCALSCKANLLYKGEQPENWKEELYTWS